MDIREVIDIIIFLEICFSNLILITTLLWVVVKTWVNRKLSGISMNFLLLWTVASLFKYVLASQPDKLEIPARLVVVSIMYYVVQLTLLFLMVSTFLISLWAMNFDDEEFEDKFDIWCFPIGFIVSFILGVDHYRSTVKDMWMIGLYLEVAAWIPQLKLCLKKKSVDSHVLRFNLCMLPYEILNITGFCYDFYRHNLNFEYKPLFLKTLLLCGFVLNFWQRLCSQNKVNEILPVTSEQAMFKKNLRPRKGSDKPVHCIRVEAAVSLTEEGLMTRY